MCFQAGALVTVAGTSRRLCPCPCPISCLLVPDLDVNIHSWQVPIHGHPAPALVLLAPACQVTPALVAGRYFVNGKVPACLAPSFLFLMAGSLQVRRNMEGAGLGTYQNSTLLSYLRIQWPCDVPSVPSNLVRIGSHIYNHGSSSSGTTFRCHPPWKFHPAPGSLLLHLVLRLTSILVIPPVPPVLLVSSLSSPPWHRPAHGLGLGPGLNAHRPFPTRTWSNEHPNQPSDPSTGYFQVALT